PREWIATAAGKPIDVRVGARGWYHPETGRMSLADLGEAVDGAGPLGKSALHELWHHLESVIPDLVAAEWAYHWWRTSSGDVGGRRRDGRNGLRSLADLLPGLGYGRGELTREDGFADPFVGREYVDQGMWEIGAMAVESLFAGSSYLDPDLREWIMGVLGHLLAEGAA
ncbi:MAG TPA: hypothetical protein VFP72_12290, partial [Kineosporiaceae bacterium]|nr:hypothetical protein [Kineosporiaceae bacterium]